MNCESECGGGSAILVIPGLPNDVAWMILSKVPYSHHGRLKATCKSWKTVLSSKSFLTSLNRKNHLLCIFPQDPSIVSPFLFDPVALAWCPLPPMPCNPNLYGLCNFAAVPLGLSLFVLGGSLFDARSFPIDRPSPSNSTFRFDFHHFSWEPRASMLSPRGSFACAVLPSEEAGHGHIFVAGGGSRHTMFAAAGSRIRSVERYDVRRDRWVALEPLPGSRAGCVGFVGGDGGRDFWVLGGYGASRTISGVFPVDEYCTDAVVMGMDSGEWREVGDVWGDQRVRAGKIVVAHDSGCPVVFMLDGSDIFRYDMSLNRWLYESRVPRKARYNSSFGFVALDGELYVVTHLYVDSTETRRSRHHKRAGTLYIQIYNPKKKAWRSIVTKSPFNYPIDINSAVFSSISL
ncbi:hypothetical protein RJT34_18831 [Clitoria ternatea]|uniref:F-box domain-containing protein n=1 Tax=Clitoria ternatea TaxID=43366 RepID=A0AAN9IPW9_CLITE